MSDFLNTFDLAEPAAPVKDRADVLPELLSRVEEFVVELAAMPRAAESESTASMFSIVRFLIASVSKSTWMVRGVVIMSHFLVLLRLKLFRAAFDLGRVRFSKVQTAG